VRRCVLAVVAAGVGDVVVVLGHDSQRMALELGPLPVRLVVNPDFNAGQMSSVHCGLNAVGEGFDAVMICLADQPRLTAAHINSLLHAFDTLPPHQSIVVPVCNEQRGNPIVISEQVRQEVVRRGPNPGCRAYIDDHPERVCWLPVNDVTGLSDCTKGSLLRDCTLKANQHVNGISADFCHSIAALHDKHGRQADRCQGEKTDWIIMKRINTE